MKSETSIIQVTSKSRPVITIDPHTQAIYIKFSDKKVVNTLEDLSGGSIVNIDIDQRGDVVGVELIGVKEFSITGTQKMLSRKISDIPNLGDAKIGFPLQPVCA